MRKMLILGVTVLMIGLLSPLPLASSEGSACHEPATTGTLQDISFETIVNTRSVLRDHVEITCEATGQEWYTEAILCGALPWTGTEVGVYCSPGYLDGSTVKCKWTPGSPAPRASVKLFVGWDSNPVDNRINDPETIMGPLEPDTDYLFTNNFGALTRLIAYPTDTAGDLEGGESEQSKIACSIV